YSRLFCLSLSNFVKYVTEIILDSMFMAIYRLDLQ
ncbi:MAG: hypothetical protein RLZZ499_1084, partial [Cyanobacteriota bacterium]